MLLRAPTREFEGYPQQGEILAEILCSGISEIPLSPNIVDRHFEPKPSMLRYSHQRVGAGAPMTCPGGLLFVANGFRTPPIIETLGVLLDQSPGREGRQNTSDHDAAAGQRRGRDLHIDRSILQMPL